MGHLLLPCVCVWGAPRGTACYLQRRALGHPGGCLPPAVLPVALQQLVEQRLVTVAARADERRVRVPLQLDDCHLGAVHAVAVGDLQQAGVAAGVRLEAGRQHLEQLVDQVLLLRGGTVSSGTEGGTKGSGEDTKGMRGTRRGRG